MKDRPADREVLHAHALVQVLGREKGLQQASANGLDERLAGELAPPRDAGVRLGQAVRAGEVAVVRRVEPEPVAGTALLDGSGEPGMHLSIIRADDVSRFLQTDRRHRASRTPKRLDTNSLS